MRLYLVVNRYSIAIQAGIQAMHVIPELYEKYTNPVNNIHRRHPDFARNLSRWATHYKTVIVLRSFGGHDSIEYLYSAIGTPCDEQKIPHALFRESELRDTATAFGLVVPTEYHAKPFEDLNPDLQAIHEVLDKLPFAH